ncbi:MAG TPA: ribosome maturation factor RimP [Pyrinomonadaceae bacterium]|nr:ribosome maturation factor RimP [Pyrinomonadaceae bacterium]
MKSSVSERIREIAARAAEENGLEFVHAQVAGTSNKLIITVFIDNQGGVTHEDCSKVSRNLDAILDVEDFIPSAYLLEVSSPGLERELYSQKDFEKFVGSLAKVKIVAPINGQKNFRGRINAVEEDEIVFEDKTSGTVHFPYSAVAKANLEIDLDEELKRSEKRKMESGK